jgi:hypothetical protein
LLVWPTATLLLNGFAPMHVARILQIRKRLEMKMLVIVHAARLRR